MRRARSTSYTPSKSYTEPLPCTFSGRDGDVQGFLRWLGEHRGAPPDEIEGQLARFDPATRLGLKQIMSDAAARVDVHAFSDAVLKDQAGERLRTRAIDRVYHQHFEQCQKDGLYCGILAPTGAGKSIQMAVIRSLWEICLKPNILIKIIAATDKEAIKRLGAISRTIMHNEDFKRIWGHAIQPAQAKTRSEEEWSKHRVSVQRASGSVEPTIESYGALASAAGPRANLLLFDDCIDARVALESPALKATLKDKFQNQWLTRTILEDHMVLWIATRWTDDDLSGELMENPEWRFLEIAVSEDMSSFIARTIERGEIVATHDIPMITGWTPAMLEKKLSSMTEIAFNRAFRQQPWSRADRLLGSFDLCVRPELSLEEERKRAQAEGHTVYAGIDVSSTKRRGNAVFVFSVDADNRRHLLDSRIGNWSAPRLGEELNDVDQRYHPIVFVVESNALQESFIQSWQSAPQAYSFWQKLQPFMTTGQKKSDPLMGIRGLDIQFSNGGWVFAAAHIEEHKKYGGEHNQACGVCRVFHEVRNYPVYQSRDLLMALWFASRAAEQLGTMTSKEIKALLSDVPEDPFFNSHLNDLGVSEEDDGTEVDWF